MGATSTTPSPTASNPLSLPTEVTQLLSNLGVSVTFPFEGAFEALTLLIKDGRDTMSQKNRDHADSQWLDWTDEVAHIRLAILKGIGILPKDYVWPSQLVAAATANVPATPAAPGTAPAAP